MAAEAPAESRWWARRWAQNVALALVTVLTVYGLLYWDVVSRAKEAYFEGEKYMAWHESPDLKKNALDARFQREKAELDRRLRRNRITQEEYREQLDVLEFDRTFQMDESALKYAYQWYKDTYELFSPPESKWVRLAREKAPQALALWKDELRAEKVPFEDYMFE